MESSLNGNVKLVKKSKDEKKLLRKQLKASHTLLKHEGINTASLPTQSLVVANGGLGNGVSREQLQAVLQESGCVESLLMPPNKPYAFVTYGSVEEARRCHASLNGRQLQCQGQTVALYFSFVEKVGGESGVCTELPPGLKVLEDFISAEEEAGLLEAIDWAPQGDTLTGQKALKHRRVKHYGYEFRYDNNNVDKERPLPGGIPQFCNSVLKRCLRENLIDVTPDQLTINQYEPGQGIPPHVDTHSAFEDTILSLSLGAKTVMDFRHPDGRSVAVVLPERSLLVMKGESRYLWTHGITPRKFDVVPAGDTVSSGPVTSDPGDLTLSKRDTRTSFTFRRVRRMACDCAYPSACDSRRPPEAPPAPALPRDDGDASRLEARFVHRVYEEISSHFSSTRHSPWPCVRDFLRSLPAGAVLADVGCGNGKYLGINPDLWAMGCDRSHSLVQICADRGLQAFVSDALDVPLRSGVCDACISIAVIHHFSTQERRLAAVNELVRLLKPGGRALIYVWALEQEYKKQRSKYLKEKSPEQEEKGGPGAEQMTQSNPDYSQEHAGKDDPQQSQPKLSVHTNRTVFNSQDLLVPWHLKGVAQKASETSADSESSASDPVFHRYYHVFREGELENLCGRVKNITIQSSYHDQGNWCVIVEKTL
ncbi:alkylated DNA repair protein alkB homolog 8 [Anguilla anguilla]|uniref:alkylated DNA repair protein alkB homolog 8 n=1 Tax=Anguilla anguilla TaxID=7936 RepID=UPI0015A8EAB5|nr:alkylated DNA repair protein alkB homolog 8 [Anguilla anguilla]